MDSFAEFMKVLFSIGIAVAVSLMFMTSGSKSSNSDSGTADSQNNNSSGSSFSSRILFASVAVIAIIIIFSALLSSAVDTAGFPFEDLPQYGSIRGMWADDKSVFIQETMKLISLVVVATTLSFIIPKQLFGDKLIVKIVRFLIIIVATLVLNRVVYDKLSENPLLQTLKDYLSAFIAGASTVTWTTSVFAMILGNFGLGEKIAGGAIGAFIFKAFPETIPAKILSKSFSIAITIIIYLFIIEYFFGDIGNLIDRTANAFSDLIIMALSVAVMLFVGSAIWKAFTNR